MPTHSGWLSFMMSAGFLAGALSVGTWVAGSRTTPPVAEQPSA